MENLYQQDPSNFEDWEDIILWKKSSENAFNEATRAFFQSKIVKIHSSYIIDCFNNKNLSEISLIPDLFKKETFVNEEYEVSALFVNNREEERFFILKKNEDYYALDISKQYNDLFKY